MELLATSEGIFGETAAGVTVACAQVPDRAGPHPPRRRDRAVHYRQRPEDHRRAGRIAITLDAPIEPRLAAFEKFMGQAMAVSAAVVLVRAMAAFCAAGAHLFRCRSRHLRKLGCAFDCAAIALGLYLRASATPRNPDLKLPIDGPNAEQVPTTTTTSIVKSMQRAPRISQSEAAGRSPRSRERYSAGRRPGFERRGNRRRDRCWGPHSAERTRRRSRRLRLASGDRRPSR